MKYDRFLQIENGWHHVSPTNIKDLDNVVKQCEGMNPFECKGFVLVDNNFNRLSVNNHRYVAVMSSIGFQVKS